MTVSKINTLIYCLHTNHLFLSPLCINQTLIKKVMNIAFHFLTLGITLSVYHSYTVSKAWIRSVMDEKRSVPIRKTNSCSIKKYFKNKTTYK